MKMEVLANHLTEDSKNQTNTENSLAILNSNSHYDEKFLVYTNSVDIDGSMNQKFVPDNTLVDDNDNANNNSTDKQPEKENNASTAYEHSIPQSNVNVPIAVFNGMSLPPKHDLTFPGIAGEA